MKADDRVIWDVDRNGSKACRFRAKKSQRELNNGHCRIEIDGETEIFSVDHGPEKLPSEYLAHLKKRRLGMSHMHP